MRIRAKLFDSRDKDQQEIMVEGKRIKIQVLGAKRRCFTCGIHDHIKIARTNKKEVVPRPEDKENHADENASSTTTKMANTDEIGYLEENWEKLLRPQALPFQVQFPNPVSPFFKKPLTSETVFDRKGSSSDYQKPGTNKIGLDLLKIADYKIVRVPTLLNPHQLTRRPTHV